MHSEFFSIKWSFQHLALPIMKPLSDKDRALVLTRLGVKNVKGLRKWRDRLNLTLPVDPNKPPPKKRTITAVRYGRNVLCIDTGETYPSYEAVLRAFSTGEHGTGMHSLKAHLSGARPTYCGHRFRHI